MEYTCKYCNETIIIKNSQAAGGHVTNCKSNPDYAQIKLNTANGVRKALSVPRFDITKQCPSCKQDFTRNLTEKQIESKKYNVEYCSTSCFNKRHISLETRAKLAEAAQYNIANPKRIDGIVQAFKKKRLKAQEIGRERIKLNESLYVAGCMLYWGEGSKGTNSATLVNSDPYMLILYLKFLRQYWEIDESRLAIKINCYTDIHTIEEIETYWLNKLDIERTHFRKHTVNNIPISSKGVMKKSGYGTVTIQYSDTQIIQEIFGAIQEFGNFTDESWLDTAAQKERKKMGASGQDRTDDMSDGNRPFYQLNYGSEDDCENI